MQNRLFAIVLCFGLTTVSLSICSAQLLTNNSAAITVTGAAQITVKGDILNSGTGTISNNGTIDLTGNWINNASNNCFGTSTGTVILNGPTQNIAGSTPTVFNNLNLVGSGSKTLQQNETVGGGNITPGGALQLNDKVLFLNSKNLTISNSLPVAITRTTGFIESETSPASGYGYIHWNIGNSLVGNNFTFPFGNSSSADYLPVQFNVTAVGVGGTNGFASIATYPTVTLPSPNNRPLPTLITQLLSVSSVENAPFVVDRFYIFDVSNYSTPPSSNLSFTYRDSEWNTGTNTITEANLQMQKLVTGSQSWTNPPFGAVNTLTNTVTVTGWSGDYNPLWTIVDFTSPLPVELLEFKASLNINKQTDIKWVSGAEKNFDHYTIQKSSDGLNFFSLGNVTGKNDNQPQHSYYFLDDKPFHGLTFYRLMMTDKNGTITFSKIESVFLGDNNEVSMAIYPNPFSNIAYLQIMTNQLIDNSWSIEIYDAIGKVVLNKKLMDIQIGGSKFEIHKNNLPAGIYFVKVISGNSEFTSVLRMIIQ